MRIRTPKRIYSEFTRASSTKARAKKSTRIYSKHRLYKLKNSFEVLGKEALDKNTPVGKALSRWRAELMDDLGGPEICSKQQTVIIDLCVKTHLLLQSIDNWLMHQPTLINTRKKSVYPVVRERQQLADSLARYMCLLGLERRKKPLASIGFLWLG